MSDNFNPFVPGADAREFALGLNQLRATDEAAKTRKLLEEQVRLQREALEQEKKKIAQEQEKLAQEQEKIKLEREQLARQKQGYPPSFPSTSAQVSGTDVKVTQSELAKAKDLKAIYREQDLIRRRKLARTFEAKYGVLASEERAYLKLDFKGY